MFGSEAAVRKYFSKQLKAAGLFRYVWLSGKPATLLKTNSNTGAFLRILRNF